ncbi:MAG: hypothetical protein CMD18_07105 [Flavobacteriales bacterium]|nr:hypothetical protein [Flavobacteriales bacterium]
MKLLLKLLFFIFSHLTLSASFQNETFDPLIKSVNLLSYNSKHTLPIIALNTQEQLNLSFDYLSNDAKDFSYTFAKCNSNWDKAENVFFHDFAEGMEEKFITDFEFSENTSTNFIHYNLDFPALESKFLMSGNYVLIVRETETSKVVLTQKFFVSENKTIITPKPQEPIDFDSKYTSHQINFTVNHSMVSSDNPMRDFKAVIIQNRRYDNAIFNLKPSFIENNKLTFNNEKENLFEAGNEYRILDFRDLKQLSQNVEEIFFKDSIFHVIPKTDYKRAYLNYKRTSDHNGKYFINNKPRNGNPHLNSDYAYVHFRLARKIPLDSSIVFISGDINGGEINKDFKMVYKDSLEHYEAHILLKQGVYNYAYTSKKTGNQSLSWEETDGSHYQTENIYTILLYFKGFNDETEKLIGVKRFSFM